ncbi:MAG: hypothetical protein GY862_17110 [Gammaproteobacteria bacterium]|nr:hypothetical protein [Gammaproteobacteria bacterium]
MGRYCKVCDRKRPNEKFSGSGHKNHICKECARLPAEKRNRRQQMDEIYRYWWMQRNISKKNIERIKVLQKSNIKDVSELAGVALEVAELYPFRRKRMTRIARERKDLIPKLEKAGLILEDDWEDEDYNLVDEDEILGLEDCERMAQESGLSIRNTPT